MRQYPSDIAFTPAVKAIQAAKGSRESYARAERRGWRTHVTPDLAESLKLKAARGALVAQVNRGGPADKGGLKTGDVIVSVDGKPIQDSIAAMASIAAIKPGTNAKFSIIRNQQDMELTVNVGKRPAPPKNRRE